MTQTERDEKNGNWISIVELDDDLGFDIDLYFSCAPEGNRHIRFALGYDEFKELRSTLNKALPIREGRAERSEETAKLREAVRVMRDAAALGLSFAPKGPVPPGLDPTFYHTLNFNSEVQLQTRIDAAREAISIVDALLSEGEK